MIKRKQLSGLKDSTTLDLAYYEIGNAIIQEEKMGLINKETSTTSSLVLQTLPQIMKIIRIDDVAATRGSGSSKKIGQNVLRCSIPSRCQR